MKTGTQLMCVYSNIVYTINVAITISPICNGASFNSSPGVVMTYVGDTATFNWRVDESVDISRSVVEFSYTGIPGSEKRIYQRIPNTPDTWYNGYEPRTEVTYSPDNHGLGFTLSQIQTSDTGSNLPYMCDVTYLGDRMGDDDAELFIYRQPSLPTITPNPPNALEGASYSLTCSAVISSLPAGLSPGMTYTWTRDEAPLPTDRHSVDGGELTISPVERQDHQRVYSCQAREINSTLSNSKNIRIDVKYPPADLTLQEPVAPIVEGSTLVLTCVIVSPGNPATYTYHWRNNGTFSRTTSGNSLTINDVTVEDHDGAWICEVNNSVGTGQSGEILVIVNAPAEISTAPGSHVSVLYSSTLSVLCEVRAKPAASVTWTYNGADTLPAGVQPVTGNNRSDGKYTITVSTLQWRPGSSDAERRQSGGIYTCRGDNNVGDVATSGDCNLTVLYGPISISLSKEGPLTAVEGHNVSVTCSSDCSPSCSYTWSRSGDSGWSQDSATLSFPAIDRADHNTYTCVADNDHGSKSASVVINVNFGSDITSFLSSPTNLLHGVDAVLSCSVSSRPHSDVTISSEHTELESGTNPTLELDFTPVSILDSGPYRCNASNGINANPATDVKALDVKGGFHLCDDQADGVIRGQPLSVGFIEHICQFANPFHQISRANWTFVIRNATIMSNGLPDDVIIYVRDSDHEYQKTIILNISSITPGHYGTYILYSGNEYGSLDFTLQLTPEGPPIAPTNLLCTKTTAVSVYLQWVAGYHGGSQQTFVVIYTDTQTGQSYTKLVDGSEVSQGGNVTHKLTENDGITPSTTYRLQVDAQNADGHYTPGPSVTNTTLGRPEFISEPSISIKDQTASIRCEISNIKSISHLNIDVCETGDSANCDNASFTDLEAQPFEVPLPDAGGFLFTFLFYDGIDLVNTEEYIYKDGNPSTALIAGVTMGVIAVAAIIIAIVVLWREGAFAKKQSKESKPDAHYENFAASNLKVVQPEVQYEDVNLTDMGGVHDKKTYEGLIGETISKVPAVYDTFGGKDASVTKYRPSDIIPGDVISRGAVFCVQTAVILREKHSEKAKNVIIKQAVPSSGTDLYNRYLMEAAQIMFGMERCPYVVNSPGVVADSLLMENVPLGNLRQYLRGMADHAYANTADVIQKEFQGFVRDVMEGIKAIQSIKSDTLFYCLSTDHVLLGEGKICKLTGFNTAESVRQREQWEQEQDVTRPIRWLAPEAIDLKHVPASDIWAFGVLVWEIFNYGLQPYPDTEDHRIVDLVKCGHRQLEMPPATPATLCDLVSTCWTITAELRHNIDRIDKVINEVSSQ